MKADPKCSPEQAVAEASTSEQAGAGAKGPVVPGRRRFLRASLIGGAAAAVATAVKPMSTNALEPSAPNRPDEIAAFEFDEITIADLQDAMKSGKYSARSIAEKYLARIDQIDKQGPAINSIIELNPDALAIADALDKERKDKGAARARFTASPCSSKTISTPPTK